MKYSLHARRWILAVDGFGLTAYLYWLARQGGRVFYHTDGVFYLLPCVPLIFVVLYVLNGPRSNEDREDR
jgi:hypothetical protein